MNSKQENTKSIFETEDSNNVSFLDVKITPKNGRLLLRFFAKPHLVEFLLITIVLFLIITR